MNDYKYYFKLTREYLKRYRFMKSALANLDKSIALKQRLWMMYQRLFPIMVVSLAVDQEK